VKLILPKYIDNRGHWYVNIRWNGQAKGIYLRKINYEETITDYGYQKKNEKRSLKKKEKIMQ